MADNLYRITGETLRKITAAIHGKNAQTQGYTPAEMAQAIEALPFFRMERGTMTVVSAGETTFTLPAEEGAMMVIVAIDPDTFESVKADGTAGVETLVLRPGFATDVTTQRSGFHIAHNNGAFVTMGGTTGEFSENLVQVTIPAAYGYKPGTYQYAVFYWEGWQ